MEYIVSNRSAFADQTPTISDESSNTRMVQIQLIPPHSPHMTTAHEHPITSQFNIFIAHAAITGYHKLLSTIIFPVIWTHPQLPQPILRNAYVFNPVSNPTTPQAHILCQLTLWSINPLFEMNANDSILTRDCFSDCISAIPSSEAHATFWIRYTVHPGFLYHHTWAPFRRVPLLSFVAFSPCHRVSLLPTLTSRPIIS